MAGVLITGIAVRNLKHRTYEDEMIWNLSFCKLIDWRTLWLHNTRFNPFPDWICRWGHFAVLGRALGWGHHWYSGHSLSYYSNAALFILFYLVKDREDGEAGSCWTAKLVHCKLQGKRTVKVPCKGKGSWDREVKEMGQIEECMSWEAWKGSMSCPKQVRSSWEAENAQSPQPTTESASFSILGKFHFIKHSPFQLEKKG